MRIEFESSEQMSPNPEIDGVEKVIDFINKFINEVIDFWSRSTTRSRSLRMLLFR